MVLGEVNRTLWRHDGETNLAQFMDLSGKVVFEITLDYQQARVLHAAFRKAEQVAMGYVARSFLSQHMDHYEAVEALIRDNK